MKYRRRFERPVTTEELELRRGTIYEDEVDSPSRIEDREPDLLPCPVCGGEVVFLMDDIMCPHCMLVMHPDMTVQYRKFDHLPGENLSEFTGTVNERNHLKAMIEKWNYGRTKGAFA